MGVVVGDENHRCGVDELADHGRAVVSHPQQFALGQPFPKMEDIDIAELRRHVRDHRGGHGPERERPHLEENGKPAGGVADHLPRCRIEGFEARQDTTEPHDKDHPDVEQETDEDHEICSPTAIELADEIGAEKGQRVGQDADGDGENQVRAITGHHLAELDEAADAEDVKHGQSAEKEAGEDQEHTLAPSVKNRSLDGVELAFGCHS